MGIVRAGTLCGRKNLRRFPTISLYFFSKIDDNIKRRGSVSWKLLSDRTGTDVCIQDEGGR